MDSNGAGQPYRHRPIAAEALDHVCVCVENIECAIQWYHAVLGLELRHTNEPCFYPTDPTSPAFLSSGGGAAVALLPLAPEITATRNHHGAHFALTLTRAEFGRARADLPALLAAHRVTESQSTEIEEADYGLQHCLFFSDPSHNIIELTTWDV